MPINQPTMAALRQEDAAWRLAQINAHFGTNLQPSDITVLGWDICGILPQIVQCVVAGKTYQAERYRDAFTVYRLEVDGGRTLIWTF